jgi:hypothetical protein
MPRCGLRASTQRGGLHGRMRPRKASAWLDCVGARRSARRCIPAHVAHGIRARSYRCGLLRGGACHAFIQETLNIGSAPCDGSRTQSHGRRITTDFDAFVPSGPGNGKEIQNGGKPQQGRKRLGHDESIEVKPAQEILSGSQWRRRPGQKIVRPSYTSCCANRDTTVSHGLSQDVRCTPVYESLQRHISARATPDALQSSSRQGG